MINLEEGQEIKGRHWAIPFIVVLKYRDFIICKQKHNKTISNILLIDTLTNTVYYGIKSLSFLNSNVTTQKHYLDEIKDLLDLEVKNFLEKFDWKYFLIEDFNSLPNLIQKEVIRYIFFISNWNSTIWLTSKNIDEVIKFINWKNNKTKKEIKQMKLGKDNKKILY